MEHLHNLSQLLLDYFNKYSEATKSNQFLAMLLAGGFFGALWYRGLSVLVFIKNRITDIFLVRVDFSWTTEDISEMRIFGNGFLNFISANCKIYSLSLATYSPNTREFMGVSIKNPAPKFSLSNGFYLVRYKYVFFLVSIANHIDYGISRTTTVIRFFKWNFGTIEEIVDIVNHRDYDDVIMIGHLDKDGSWLYTEKDTSTFVPPPVTSVYDMIAALITKWLTNRKEGKYIGLPNKLSLLLKGPPGTGKSTMIETIGARFFSRVYYVQLSLMTDSVAANLPSTIDPGSLVVFEDPNFSKEYIERDSSKLSVSALLNLLESSTGLKDCVVVINHNNPETFDPRFLQAGRIGHTFALLHWTEEELKLFLDRHYPDRDICVTKYFSCLVDPATRNPKRCELAPAAYATCVSDNIDDYDGFLKSLGVFGQIERERLKNLRQFSIT